MIGLVYGLRKQADKIRWGNFGGAPQIAQGRDCWCSFCQIYYKLLDACPLRIPHAQQHGAEHG